MLKNEKNKNEKYVFIACEKKTFKTVKSSKILIKDLLLQATHVKTVFLLIHRKSQKAKTEYLQMHQKWCRSEKLKKIF